MKKLLLPILFLIGISTYAQYDHQNIDLLGTFSDTTVVSEPVYGIKYQAVWGWVDITSGKEYAILGSTAGTYIVDVSNPSSPVQVDYIPHHQTDCIWHEYKTYGNYLYIISDDAGTGFQIADLSYLPDSVHLIYDSVGLFEHAHTIFIDGDKMYLGSVSSGFNYSSMNVYSLANPAAPVLLRRLDQDYSFINTVHDMYVVNDTVYASCGGQGLYILRYNSAINQFVLISALQDPATPYNHSSFLSPDHHTLYLCEEVPDGQPVKIIDVADIVNPQVVDTFYSNAGATPHNPEVKDNMLILAYYQDGVYIYDISNPQTPIRLGYFDTYPTNTLGSYLQPAYAGCWSTYAELPSGILLAGDMQSGLFTLDISQVNVIKNSKGIRTSVFPNPASDFIQINNAQDFNLEITDLSGRIIVSGNITEQEKRINIDHFNSGLYLLRLTGNNKTVSNKIVVVNN